jgi:hypothetical protein
MDEVLVERVRVALVALDAEEDVGRPLGAVLRINDGGADDLALGQVLQHEEKLALRHRQNLGEGPLRSIKDGLDVLGVGREIDGVEVLGHGQDLSSILTIRLANSKHANLVPAS